MEAATASDLPQRTADGQLEVCRDSSPSIDVRLASTEVGHPDQCADIRAVQTGLKFKNDVPYAVWSALGLKLARRKNSACWWLGDWLVFGQHHYRRYMDAIETTGLDYQTLRNDGAVARRFPVSRRRDDLSFQHHAAVAALTEADQDRWLTLAATHGWSLHAFRDRLREAESPSRSAKTHTVRFRIDSTREHRWRQTATDSGVSLHNWIIQTLDAAAVSDVP